MGPSLRPARGQLDVALRLYQIVSIQALFYLSVSLSVTLICWISGLSPDLALILSSSMIDFSYSDGWVAPIAYLLASIPVVVAIYVYADRARHCLDFATTVFVVHVAAVVLYMSRFPTELQFWILILICVILTSIGSEVLCLRRQARLSCSRHDPDAIALTRIDSQ